MAWTAKARRAAAQARRRGKGKRRKRKGRVTEIMISRKQRMGRHGRHRGKVIKSRKRTVTLITGSKSRMKGGKVRYKKGRVKRTYKNVSPASARRLRRAARARNLIGAWS